MPRILVVDRDEELHSLLCELFSSCGWTHVAATGTTVCEALSSARPDVMIVDSWLDRRDAGWAVVEAIRASADTASIPILVWADLHTLLESRADWLEAEGIPVMQKPFEIEELVTTITGLLGGDTDSESG